MLFESQNLRLTADYGIATLTLAVAGRERNILSREVLHDLDAALTVAHGQRGLDVLVIRSGRESGFGYGADLAEFSELQNPSEVSSLTRLGQRVTRRLAALPTVTVALIDGCCLDGALELSLACDWRVAVGGPTTRLGFRQLRFGAIPCWGGAVLLPRVIGLKAALDLFFGEQRLSAAQALRIRLIDQAVGPRLANVHLDAFVLGLQQSFAKRRPRPWLADRLPWRQQVLLNRAERQIERSVSPDHRAPRELLQVVKAGLIGGPAEGRAAARAAMGRLARSIVASDLSSLAPIGRLEHQRVRTLSNLRIRVDGSPSVAKDESSVERNDLGRSINSIGIVGAGTIGAALAQWAALRGCRVAIQERDAASASAARTRLADQFWQAVGLRLIPADDAASRIDGIFCGTSWNGFKDVDLVIEATDEVLVAKQRILRQAEQHVSANAIIATTSTSFTVRELQEKLARPERLVGLHLGHPAAAQKLAELTAGPATDPSVVTRLRLWLRSQGKFAGLVSDRPGRVLGRVVLPYFHEAVLLAEDGISPPVVDAALRRFGFAWGPLEALDAIGLDVVSATLHIMAQTYGPTLTPPPLVERLVKAGWHGRKTGVGFYRYDKTNPMVNQAEFVTSGAEIDDCQVVGRCVGRLLNAAHAGLGEGLVHDAVALDGLLVGAGWPAFRGGPLRFAHVRGLGRLHRELTNLAGRHRAL